MTREREHGEHVDAATEPALRAALREAFPEPPLEAVDWVALEGRIRDRSSPVLEALATRRHAWVVHVSRWAGAGIPLAAAAVLALAMALPGTRPRGPARPASPAAVTPGGTGTATTVGTAAPGSESAWPFAPTLEGALLTTGADATLSFLGSSDPGEALLAAALEEE